MSARPAVRGFRRPSERRIADRGGASRFCRTSSNLVVVPSADHLRDQQTEESDPGNARTGEAVAGYRIATVAKLLLAPPLTTSTGTASPVITPRGSRTVT